MSAIAINIEWLTTAEAAEILGRSAETVRRYCERGTFKGAYQPRAGDQWRIPLASVVAFVESVQPIRRKAQ